MGFEKNLLNTSSFISVIMPHLCSVDLLDSTNKIKVFINARLHAINVLHLKIILVLNKIFKKVLKYRFKAIKK